MVKGASVSEWGLRPSAGMKQRRENGSVWEWRGASVSARTRSRALGESAVCMGTHARRQYALRRKSLKSG